MISFRAFEVLISIITGSRERETREHYDFLKFYQNLVEIVPDAIASEFGSIKVPTVLKGVLQEGYRLELTPTDFLWWKTIIDEGGRFANSISSIQRDVWDKLNTLVRDNTLTDEQRKALFNVASDLEAA